jgi:hypothetical protein
VEATRTDPGQVTSRRIPAVPPLIVRLALELIVVFVGVYAAFVLSEYQEDRKASQRRRQLEAALVREIQDITTRTRRVAKALPAQLARFDSAVAAGARPPLEPEIEPVRVQTHMWEATLQSGALDFFDVPTVFELSRFYNELNAGFEQLAQLRHLSETVLIPNLGRGADEFYQPADGKLRPKYQWYRDGLQRLAGLAMRITELGDSAVAKLQSGNGSSARS